ncbi:hypothetical protein YC2023_093467 [Brassica napus]
MALSKLQSVVLLVICSLLVTSQSRVRILSIVQIVFTKVRVRPIRNARVGVDRRTFHQRPLPHAKSELTAPFVVKKKSDKAKASSFTKEPEPQVF